MLAGQMAPRRAPRSVRFPPELEQQLRAHAANEHESENGLIVKAVGEYLAGQRDADDLVWVLVGVYGPAHPEKDAPLGDPRRLGLGQSPVATFEVSPDLDVTATIEPSGPPLEQYVEIAARREDGQTVVELRGHAADPRFAGVALRIGALNATAGKLVVRLEDLAPSLQPEAS